MRKILIKTIIKKTTPDKGRDGLIEPDITYDKNAIFLDELPFQPIDVKINQRQYITNSTFGIQETRNE